jgi:hypothetical protein
VVGESFKTKQKGKEAEKELSKKLKTNVIKHDTFSKRLPYGEGRDSGCSGFDAAISA